MKTEAPAPGQVQRAINIGLLSLAALLLVFATLIPLSTLVRWAELYIKSVPGRLSEESVVWLQQLKLAMIIAGAILLILPLGLRFVRPWLSRLGDSLARRLDPGAIGARVVNWLGTLGQRLFGLASREQTLWILLVLILVTIPVAGFFLSPAGGFHVEGIDLQQAKNLARHGFYATLTTRGFDELTFRSSAGPGVILPSSLAFWLFGVNVYYARAVAFLFLIAAAFVSYRLARLLYDKGTAWLTTFLVLPTFMMFDQGGTGMAPEGYMPGFMWFVVGSLLWFKAVEKGEIRHLWLAGLGFGLAFQTKWLFLFSLIALMVTWVLLRISGNRIGHRYWLLPSLGLLGVTAAWTLFKVLNLGLRQEVTHLREFWVEHGIRAVGVKSSTGLLTGPLSSIRPVTTLAQVDLWGELQLFLLIPAVLYVLFRLLKGRLADYRSLFLVVFGLIWFSWWLVFNYDLVWDHLLVPRFVGTFFIAHLLTDAWRLLAPQRTRFVELLGEGLPPNRLWAYLGRATIAVVVVLSLVVPLASRANTIYVRYHSTTKPYLEMRSWVLANTEKDAVFSGWAWSLPFYLDLDPAGDHITKDRATYPLEHRESVPEYFIISPEWPLVKTSDLYPNAAVDNEYNRRHNALRKQFVAEHCEFLKSFGSADILWQVYKVRLDPPDVVGRKG